ncbi:MAG: imidazole glycerol phosphate synthase cyclase subunit [Bacteroidia bacterium]|jgi:cyclase|nr:imidazole glycerol phosphate synthase cyclase subunit [Bacteroidia bacterium]
MTAKRIIARLDVKGNRLIKGIHLEGWRFLGDPNEYCLKYYEQGIDEIIYVDAVASLYNRDSIKEIVRKTTENVFVPLTVGGGIRTLEDATEILRSGADKVAINTAAIKNPNIISEIANRFGKQCMVLSVQAKKRNNMWVAAYDSAREYTNMDVLEWIEKAVELGAGEILLTSVDKEGTQKGFDNSLVDHISKKINVPIIACGGFGNPNHAIEAFNYGADAVAIAHALHYNKCNVKQLKSELSNHQILIRP